MEAVVDAAEGMRYGGPVAGPLGGVLVVEHPAGDPGADGDAGGGLEEQVAATDAIDAGGAPVAKHDRTRPVDAADRVEDQAPPPW